VKLIIPFLLAIFLIFAVRPASAETPAARCAGLGTSNTLLPVPEALAGEVNAVFGTAMPAAMVAATTVYRCAGGQVMVCTVGANLPCGPADASRVPNAGEIAWCKDNRDADFIPAYATGHDTIFAWRCRGGAPGIAKQILDVDAEGFIKQFWKPLGPETVTP
jgi:hypothetical protein